MKNLHLRVALLGALFVFALCGVARGARVPGVTDTEIKIGQTMPYSGPVSAFGTLGRAEAAYFAMINETGGINGRRIRLISLDDGYSPPRTVEQTRRLVEQEEVLMIFSSLGTAANMSIRKYPNARKVPHLFIASVANKWNDAREFPWSMAVPVPPRIEAKIYARYVVAHHPDARIGVLYQNDDYGKDYLASLREGLGSKAAHMIIAEQSYEVTDPTPDSQIVALKAAGVDVLMSFTNPKFEAMALRKIHDLRWSPVQVVPAAVSSYGAVLLPAGPEKAKGLISATTAKDPTDPTMQNDKGVQEWLAWMRKYYPEGNVADTYNVAGYIYAQMLVRLLKECSDDLSRENILRHATNIDQWESPMLLPGIKLKNSPSNYYPLRQMQMRQFDGKQWVRFGEVIGE